VLSTILRIVIQALPISRFVHGHVSRACIVDKPIYLAYLSADRRFVRLTVDGQRVLDGVLAVFALGGVPVPRRQIVEWRPVEECGLDPRLVALSFSDLD
jgi:hypothetical protein